MGFFASSGILNQRGFFSAPVSAAPPAPSGIPVASTTSIVITFGDVSQGTYLRYDYPTFIQYLLQDPPGNIGFITLSFYPTQGGTWKIEQYSAGEESELVYRATNASLDGTTIPTTGWTYTVGSGLPITITAA